MIGSHLLDKLLKNPNNTIIGIDNLSYGSKQNIEHNLSNLKFSFYEIDIFDLNTLGIKRCRYYSTFSGCEKNR